MGSGRRRGNLHVKEELLVLCDLLLYPRLLMLVALGLLGEHLDPLLVIRDRHRLLLVLSN